MTFEIAITLIALAFMLVALVADRMRPGMVLLSVSVFFLCTGIISPSEMLEGFSNKGMITVALLFLVSEGVRRSGALSVLIRKMLPQKQTTVLKGQTRMFPAVAFISAFLNNTPVVVIFAPIIKRWAENLKLPPTKFLIPLSYVTILGGMCTLIGTSTNLVVDGLIISAGYEGLTMFELGKVGIFVAAAGVIYLLIFSQKLLPEVRSDLSTEENVSNDNKFMVEIVLGARFPGNNKTLGDFDFERHYGATVREIKRNGQSLMKNLNQEYVREGDTLVLWADESFLKTWGETSVFVILTDRNNEPQVSRGKRWLALALLAMMIVGASIGELPVVKETLPAIKLDMFFFAAVTTVIMAWTNLFPPKNYAKFISWDVLITIAFAFAINKALTNSGLADMIAASIVEISSHYGPQFSLAALFLITNIFTELITNNAAAALTFPVALALSEQLGVNPIPFFVTICIAASSSFATPIGYQTNLIVQGVGNYKFTDYLKVGLPMNVIAFLVSVILIPLIWPF